MVQVLKILCIPFAMSLSAIFLADMLMMTSNFRPEDCRTVYSQMDRLSLVK